MFLCLNLWCRYTNHLAVTEMFVVEACDSVRLVVVTFQHIVLLAIVIIALTPITEAVVTLIPQPFLELAHNSLILDYCSILPSVISNPCKASSSA